MTNALPGKRGFWGNLVQGAKAIFAPPIYMADKNAETQRLNTERMIETQRYNTDRMIEANERRDRLQAQMKQAEMQLQVLQQEKNLAFQAEQGELNRELQGELARLNRDLQAEEGMLNRQLQGELARLNREFQANEGKLNRQHALEIELFRENLQQALFAQQKQLQLELKQLDAELARELRVYDRQTAIELIQEQKRQNNSPIWLVAEDLINSHADIEPIPLRVFFSPPALRHDRSEATGATRGFPEMEQALGQSLRTFFEKYTQNGRPIGFIAGAWTSKVFHSEAATHAIFRGLKTEPVLILESTVEGVDFNLNFGYWGVSWANYRYKTAISFPWQEALYEFAKMRTLRWKQDRDAHIAAGKEPSEFDEIYSQETTNRFLENIRIIERERRCLEMGRDLRELDRRYSIHQIDYEALQKFIANCHCLFAGLLADEYFLLHVPVNVRKRPLLPQLLADLMEGMPEQQLQNLVELMVAFYETLYQEIAKSESGWVPELKLDLAASLQHLPQQYGAKQQVDASMQAWLQMRGIAPGENLLAQVYSALVIADVEYVEKLNQCLLSLGDQRQLFVADACYNRGMGRCRREEYVAAIADFDQVIALQPDRVEAYYNRGLARAKIEQYDGAIQDYTEVVRLQPRRAEAYNNRGNAYYQLGSYSEAIANYDKAVELGFSSAEKNRAIARGVLAEVERKKREEEERRQREEEERRLGKIFEFEVATVNAKGRVTNRSRQQGRVLREDLGNNVVLEMVYIPGGTFMMGSPDDEEGRDSNEGPQHRVTVASFHMGKYPITQAQWKIVMGNNPSFFQGANLPVENVSWHDAVEFCQRLSQKTGKTYRLPSEAEWEYACRAGTTTPFHFGETITTEFANYDGNYTYAKGPKGIYREKTTPVGSFRVANAFGLYDMHGNVWEWCADPWHENYQGAPSDGSVWESGGSSSRMLRGGGWDANPRSCRCAVRDCFGPGFRFLSYGLRVVCVFSR